MEEKYRRKVPREYIGFIDIGGRDNCMDGLECSPDRYRITDYTNRPAAYGRPANDFEEEEA